MYGLKNPCYNRCLPVDPGRGARVVDTGLKFSLPKWRLTRWLTHAGHGTPADIRAALLASLFGTLPIFAGGVINTVLISGIVAWRRPEPLYLSWLILELALAAVRVMVLRSALRARGTAATRIPTSTSCWRCCGPSAWAMASSSPS